MWGGGEGVSEAASYSVINYDYQATPPLLFRLGTLYYPLGDILSVTVFGNWY